MQTSSTSMENSKKLALDFSRVDKSANVGDFCAIFFNDAVNNIFIIKDHLCLSYTGQLINSRFLIQCIYYIIQTLYPSVLIMYFFISPGRSHSPVAIVLSDLTILKFLLKDKLLTQCHKVFKRKRHWQNIAGKCTAHLLLLLLSKYSKIKLININ